MPEGSSPGGQLGTVAGTYLSSQSSGRQNPAWTVQRLRETLSQKLKSARVWLRVEPWVQSQSRLAEQEGFACLVGLQTHCQGLRGGCRHWWECAAQCMAQFTFGQGTKETGWGLVVPSSGHPDDLKPSCRAPMPCRLPVGPACAVTRGSWGDWRSDCSRVVGVPVVIPSRLMAGASKD